MKPFISGTNTFVVSVIAFIYNFLAGVCIIWVRSEWSSVYGIITVIATIEGSYAAEFDDYTGLKYFALYSLVNLVVTVTFGLCFLFGYFIPCSGLCHDTYRMFGMIFAIAGGAFSILAGSSLYVVLKKIEPTRRVDMSWCQDVDANTFTNSIIE